MAPIRATGDYIKKRPARQPARSSFRDDDAYLRHRVFPCG